ncbi:MAG: LamG domain-containing protein [Candidatus Omnitrophica bacterium]|nr:LamG domain-containing protein [Candidatus Omnitrophota bacterium]
MWISIAKTKRGVTTFLDASITSYTTYRYRVNAFSGTEKTAYSNEDTLFLPGIFPPIADTATLLCWHFNDSGPTIKDASQYSRDGINTMGDHLAGRFDNALYFSDSAFASTTVHMDYPGTSLSVEFWIKPRATLSASTERTGLLQTLNGPITIYYYNGRLVAEYAGQDSVKSVFAEQEFLPNQWYQVVVSFSSGKIKMFVDCKLIGMQAIGFNTKLTSDALYVGKARVLNTDRFYEGYVDELRIRRNAEEYFR